MEQSYKEKYEQAIERLKQWDREHPCAGFVLSDRDKFIFPELAENKDEKIRKEIINYFKCQSEEEPTRKEIHNKWIAWLENVPVTIDHEKREGFHLGYKACLEKQGEKKPADSYCQENCKGFQETGKCFADGECKSKREAEQKPASEEDEPQKELAKSYLAKFDEKFPILPTLKGKQLADYKNFLNKCQQIFGLRYWGFRPLQAKLFEKLSLLWAAWGAEHLQGLGQTDGDMDNEISMWSDEDEEVLKQIDASLRVAENYYFSDGFREEVKGLRNWLKSLRPQNRWKPSSEQIGLLQAIINEPNNASSESCQIVLKDILEQLKKLKKEQA